MVKVRIVVEIELPRGPSGRGAELKARCPEIELTDTEAKLLARNGRNAVTEALLRQCVDGTLAELLRLGLRL